MAPRAEMPPGQRRVYQAIRIYVAQHKGRPPSLRDLCAALGVSSVSSVSRHVHALAARGVLTITPGVHRGIELTEDPAK